jgi:hypothetical protein
MLGEKMTDQPEFFDITQQGLTWLREDMENFSSFDPNRPYEEKKTTLHEQTYQDFIFFAPAFT